jgi:hypothetical protein
MAQDAKQTEDEAVKERSRKAAAQARAAAATPQQPERANSAFSTNSTDPRPREKAGKEKMQGIREQMGAAGVHGKSSRGLPPEENEENPLNGPVEWAKNGTNSAFSPNSPEALSQKAVFPPASILADYYDYAITQTEGADAYIIGAILPITAAILTREVWMPWPAYQGKLYPNLYAILAGPPGNLKSTSIYPALAIAKGVGMIHFLEHNYSPEALFDSFFNQPDRLLVCSDAGSTITKWSNPYDGERLSHSFLTLYDGESMSETFRGNRQNNNPNTQGRETGPTSLSILFGSTLNKCQFGTNSERDGLQRRFNYYLAIDKARKLDHPQPDHDRVQKLVEKFKRLTHLKGSFSWDSSAKKRFDCYKEEVEARIKDCDPFDESTRGRLNTICTKTVKVAMLFESARICVHDPQTIPGGPPLIIRKDILELAIAHDKECFQAGQQLADVTNLKVIKESAETLLANIRSEFVKFKHPYDPNAIVLTRTQLTNKYAHNPGRRSGYKVGDLYKQIIPYLIRTGDAKLLTKDGKKETYAFRVEN